MMAETHSGLGKRHVQVFLVFLMLAISLQIRNNMSVAIVAMVDNSGNPDFPELEWSTAEQGAVLGSFSWGHLVTQFLASYILSRQGPSKILPIAMCVTGMSTLLVYKAAVHGGSMAVCATRVLQGMGQAFVYPGAHTLLAKWLVPSEREKYISMSFGGSMMGSILVMGAGGFLAAGPGGWPSIFYMSGTSCLLWSVLCYFVMADSPDCHNKITPQEKNYINANLVHNSNSTPAKPPWGSIACSIPLWALTITHMSVNWGLCTLTAEIPTYLHGVFHFNVKEDGLLSALPFLCKWITAFIVAFVAQFLLKKKILSADFSRKMWNSIAMYGGGLALGALAFFNLDANGCIGLLTLSITLSCGIYPGMISNHLDLSPNFAGILIGITASFADISGILAPTVAGFIITDLSDSSQWRIVFMISAAVFIVGNTIFIIFGSTKVQPWNSVEEEKKDLEKGTTNKISKMAS